MNTEEQETRIDEELYSRQLYVLGHDAMRRMMKSKVLVVGLDGLGQEIAKNLCLAGLHAVNLWDRGPVRLRDLGAGFYFRVADVGKARDSAAAPHLAALNRHVIVTVADNADPKGYDVVVAVNQNFDTNISLSEQCRAENVKLVVANVSGLFSQVFVDLIEHTVVDKNGAPPSTGGINDISPDGVLTIADGSKHSLITGDSVRISRSMYKVTVISRTQFRLEGYETTEDSHTGGDFEQVKEPFTISYRGLKESKEAPEILCFGDEERARLLHRLFTESDTKNEDEGDSINADTGDNVASSVSAEETSPKKMCVRTKNICLNTASPQNTDLIRQFRETRNCLIAPMCSVIGGFAAQEVLKVVSGRFLPLNQFFYYDCAEAWRPQKSEGTGVCKDDRYYDLRRLFGTDGLERLMKLRIFLVGAGAIGCEHLKNFVMSGIGLRGRITVTDMDSIEQSNLNRQFLFKECDVSKLKSEAAVRQAGQLNEDYSQKDCNALVAYNLPVNQPTETTFSDDFFCSLDVIANALDNVEARNYMDGRAVAMRKAMFDSGTLGTKGHVQVVVPFVTESYASTTDAAESSIPMCTVKSYPSTIEHTIEWAMGEFRRKFNEEMEIIKERVDAGEGKVEEETRASPDVSENKEGESNVPADNNDPRTLLEEAPRNIEGCIKSALGLFVNLFSTQIQNLLSTFPADYVTKEGLPFWSSPKRPPAPLSFNINDRMHILFVESAANLFATCVGVRRISKPEVLAYLENVLSLCEPNPIRFGDEPVDLSGTQPLEYDKDTWHVDFVYSAANLRARNYKIKEQSRHFIRGVSGKIIPAIATTTAVVSGLCVLEIIKYALRENVNDEECGAGESTACDTNEAGGKTANSGPGAPALKNAFLDLAMPFLALADPVPPQQLSYEVNGVKTPYTLWSRIELKDSRLGDLIATLSKHIGRTVSMASIGSRIVYWDFSNKYDGNLNRTIAELCECKPGQLVQYVDFLTEDEVEMESVAVLFETAHPVRRPPDRKQG